MRRSLLAFTHAALWLCALLFTASAVRAEDRALLIGIGNYQTLPPRMFLLGPKNDVTAIHGVLSGVFGYKEEAIKTLRDEQATRAGILSAIEDWLIAGTGPGDRVYLYFSGHGLQVADTSGDEDDKMDEALATYDIAAGATDWTNVILDDDIEALVEKMKDRNVTIVIDACHSGTISRSIAPGSDGYIEGARYLPRPSGLAAEPVVTRGLKIELATDAKSEKIAEGALTTFSAAAPYQIAWDDDRLPPEDRHGVFTSAYVAGLTEGKADNNGNGLTSFSELYQYLKVQSAEYCKVKDNCQSLDPQIEASPQLLGATVASYKPATATEVVKTEEVKLPAVAQPVIVDANPVQSVADILGGRDDGTVSVSIDAGATLKNGAVFKIAVTSTVGGQLVLLDVNGKGEATQIFPNTAAQKITPLSPGNTLTIPDDYYGFDFQADGAGDNVLVAIVVNDDIDLSKLVPADRGLQVTLNARGALSEIVDRLTKMVATDDGYRAINWTAGSYKYSIE